MTDPAVTPPAPPVAPPTSVPPVPPKPPRRNDDDGFEPEVRSAAYLRGLREEAKEARERSEALMANLTAAEQRAKDVKAELDALAVKAAKDVDDTRKAAKEESDQRFIRAEMKAFAIKAGIIDVDGLKFADLSAIKLTKEGEVEAADADAIIAKLKEAKPYLFGSATGTSSTATPPPATPPGGVKQAKDMSKEEYDATLAKLRRGK